MNNGSKKILILGTTGRTGKWILKEAIDQRYSINVLVRDKTKITENAQITIFEGTPSDKQKLSAAAKGCEAIINVLNISRTSDFPWAKLRTPRTFLSNVMQNAIEVCEEQQINRVVVCSAWGVAETFKDLPFWFQLLVRYSNIGVTYADHERQEKLLMATDLDWTIVRPVGLTDTRKSKELNVSYDNSPKPKLTIGRAAVAKFMVEALTDPSLIGKKPVIWTD